MTQSEIRARTHSRGWRRRKWARPQDILLAAAEVFGAKGYARARMSDIAACAGITKGTIYLYFVSKKELYEIAMAREDGITRAAE